MKIAIVDDDRLLFKTLSSYLTELLGSSVKIFYFQNGEEFLAAKAPEEFDLLILDIFMGKLNGVEVAKKVRQSNRTVKIVFCTTSNEFASESYEVNACYYLLKPFTRAGVKAMLDRLDLAALEQLRTVRLPDGTDLVLRSIIYADCAAHRVQLHCKQQKVLTLRAPFAEIEQLLCAYPYFFSPTKGVIINFYEVTARTGNLFTLSCNANIPISRRKAKEVLEAYSAFRFKQLRKGGPH